jgi:hypothetical protein
LFDDIARFFEFNKFFNKWFFIQILRNSWPALVLLGSTTLLNAEIILIYVGAFIFIFALCIHISVYGSKKIDIFSGAKLVIKSLRLLTLPFLMSLITQGPKILVIYTFPNIAYFFSIITQTMGGIQMILFVKMIVPYRRLISLKPFLYFQAVKKCLTKVTFIEISLILFSQLGYFLGFQVEINISFLVAAIVLSSFRISLFTMLYPWIIEKYNLRIKTLDLLVLASSIIYLVYFLASNTITNAPLSICLLSVTFIGLAKLCENKVIHTRSLCTGVV